MSEQMVEIRERIAKAIVRADERNGGPPWGLIMTMGKHVVENVWDRADEVLRDLTSAGYSIVPRERNRV